MLYPLAAAPRMAPPRRSRSALQRCWDGFDRLNDLQTVAVLMTTLLGMLTISAVLIRAVVVTFPESSAPVAAVAPANTAPPAAAAQPVAPAAPSSHLELIQREVNLRSAPGIHATVLATLPEATWVWAEEGTAWADDMPWQHVRTDDSRDGWVIATVLS